MRNHGWVKCSSKCGGWLCRFCGSHRIYQEPRDKPRDKPPDGQCRGGDLATRIQELYRYNDDESGFGEGVESVTLTFPKAAQSKVTAQLSGFPPSLSSVAGSPLTGSGKSIHVRCRAGTRSLPVLEQPLDIEVSDTSIFVCLNNPAKPGWMVVAPGNKPPMSFNRNLRVMDGAHPPGPVHRSRKWSSPGRWSGASRRVRPQRPMRVPATGGSPGRVDGHAPTGSCAGRSPGWMAP